MYIIRNARNGFFYNGFDSKRCSSIFETSHAEMFYLLDDAVECLCMLEDEDYYDLDNITIIDLSDKIPNHED